MAGVTGVALETKIPEVEIHLGSLRPLQIHLDPCDTHRVTIKYSFFLRVESIHKDIEIYEDGFYCKEEKRKEQELKERRRAEKERQESIEQERVDNGTTTTIAQTTAPSPKTTTTPTNEPTTETTPEAIPSPKTTPTLTQNEVEGKEEEDKTPANVGESLKGKKAQIGIIAAVSVFSVLSITVVIVSYICWQKNQKKANQESREENDTYGSYARGFNGEGDYGDGDKVYVTDNNFYYGT